MLRQQEAVQAEMAKALQTPFAPLTELARKNVEMWEQMQSATRDAFTGRGADSKGTERDHTKTQTNRKKGK
jgi:hypothetical protein